MQTIPDQEIVKSLQGAGLLKSVETASFEALAGGVSSDIWRVETAERVYCVKRALSKLNVQADWFAPVERNLFEVAWYQVANEIVPGSAPHVITHDEIAMLCVMEYLDLDVYKLWKSELRDGRADESIAMQVGVRLGLIHSGTAGYKTIRAGLPDVDIFHPIRLEPYLEATAVNHPDLKEQLFLLSQRTAGKRLTMIHGDVSPKNILLGSNGPVFIDAECACIGDPAFDLAFCLNHFLLKCLWKPDYRQDFIACFKAMYSGYLSQVTWEDSFELETRTASLLPGLFLARVDGKSPVEYITEKDAKMKVRRCARTLLFSPPDRLSEISDAWNKELLA